MRTSHFASILSIFVAFALSNLKCVSASSADTLHVNAIVGLHGVSQLECWSLLPGFTISTQVRPPSHLDARRPSIPHHSTTSPSTTSVIQPGTVGSKQLQFGAIANGSYTL